MWGLIARAEAALGGSEGDLDRIDDRLHDLSAGELQLVLAGLTDRQLDVLFHNVHSSGFWSDDWNHDERRRFYDNLARLGETGSPARCGTGWGSLARHQSRSHPRDAPTRPATNPTWPPAGRTMATPRRPPRGGPPVPIASTLPTSVRARSATAT